MASDLAREPPCDFRDDLEIELARVAGGIGFGRGEEVGDVDVLCKATTLKMKTRERTSTTTGSTFNPGDSSVYSPVRRTC